MWKLYFGCFLIGLAPLSAGHPSCGLQEKGRLLCHFHAGSSECEGEPSEEPEYTYQQSNRSCCQANNRPIFGRRRFLRCGQRPHPRDCCCCKCAPIYDDSDKDDLAPDQNAYWPTKKTDSWMRELKW